MRKNVFLALLIGIYLSLSFTAFAQTDTSSCISCHGAAANFTTPLVNKVSACNKCHYQSSHPGVDPSNPTAYGYFYFGTNPDLVPSSALHTYHYDTNRWSIGYGCVRCHGTADCTACHESIPHTSHSTTLYTPVTLTVANGSSYYTTSLSCANSACHNQLPTITSYPSCTNCHTTFGHGDITAKHESSDVTPGCLGSNCHSSSNLTTEHQNRGYDCFTCHNNPDPLRAATLRKAIDSNNTSCSACHTVHADITTAHTSPANNCTECHSANIMTVHSDNCSKCHNNLAVSPISADCVTCHSTKPHSVSCTICHGTKYASTTYYRASDIHMKHVDKALCGVCHKIPASTTLERTGKYCAVCHGSAKSYDPAKVYDIHKRHAEPNGVVPNTCNLCHGKTTPAGVTSKSCTVCHPNTSSYSFSSYSNKLTYLHRKHSDVECTNCHHDVQLTFDRSQSCLRCHDIKSYRSRFSLHKKHFGPKAMCNACHGSTNVYASAGYTCRSCHGYTPSYWSHFDVHKKHAGREYPCIVCHTLK